MEKIFLIYLFGVPLMSLNPAGASHKTTFPEEIPQRVIDELGRYIGSSQTIGYWSEWSPWSSCTRTCGSGVKTQLRKCQTNRRQLDVQVTDENNLECVGHRKRFQLCNIQPCKKEERDFRKIQCAAYNKTPFNKKFYRWEPYVDSVDSCILNCRPMGLQFYATLNQSVIDGTPCGDFQQFATGRPDRFCIEGTCIKMGCDGLLGSGRKRDTCGLCGGDNSTCRSISGVYAKTRLPFGYNLITTIPSGTRNISFLHLKPSNNFLALRAESYLLNGPFGLNSSGTYKIAGTTFQYGRSQTFGGDILRAEGPTEHTIDVMVFYQNINPGIKYSYIVPVDDADVIEDVNRNRLYSTMAAETRTPWASLHLSNPMNDADPLSNSISRDNYVGLESKYTDNKAPYYKKQKKKKKKKASGKKSKKSKFSWMAQGFTSCSRSCGGGSQTTRHVCVKSNRRNKEVPLDYCAHLDLPDERTILCNIQPCPPQWEPGEWSSCSVTCGLGVQIRPVQCSRQISSDQTVTVPKYLCEGVSIPHLSQVCEKENCDGPPRWETGPWSSCSSPCGLGTRKRNVTCGTVHGILERNKCPQMGPSDEEICDMGSCATDTWLFSDWEDKCHGPCGKGFQTRLVHCSGNSLNASQNSCSIKSKPSSTRPCDNEEKCSGSWFMGPWSDCNINCGEGRKRRTVVCVLWVKGKYKVSKDDSYCKTSGERPPDSIICNVECKLQWFTSNWSECSRSCDGGVQRREIKCLDEFLLPSLDCSRLTKPDSRQSCNNQPCDSKDSADRQENDIFSQSDSLLSNDSADDSSLFPSGSCVDRMKNCSLVFKARLCKLRYYYKLCCQTCSKV